MARRAGFTMIELLTVMGIIAVLIALLLPAVQSAREAARRMQCVGNLVQFGVAMANYASTHNVLPPGVVEPKGPILNVPKGYHMGWAVQILPFIEQRNRYAHIDFRRGVYDDANTTALGARLGLFMCPSGRAAARATPAATTTSRPRSTPTITAYSISTAASATTTSPMGGPTRSCWAKPPMSMMLGWASGTRDTLRNTGSPINAPDATIPTGRGRFVIPPPDKRRAELQSLVEDGVVPLAYVGGFSSKHSFGANFLFCDGSVHFLKEAIDPQVYPRYLGHRADGEIIDGDQY